MPIRTANTCGVVAHIPGGPIRGVNISPKANIPIAVNAKLTLSMQTATSYHSLCV